MWMDPDQYQIASKYAGTAKAWIPALGRTVISVVGGLGTVIAFFKTGFDLLQNRTLLAKRDSELERAGQLADLLEKFSRPQVNKEHQEALNESVQSCLQQCLANVSRINARLAELNRDPNAQLSLHEKIFLMFRPSNWRGWVLQVLAYSVLALCGWYIFEMGVKDDHFSRQEFLTAWQHSFTYLFLAFFIVVAMVLRAWALEERRRSLGFHTEAGRLGRWFVMRFPESWRMLLAQTMFFMYGMFLVMIVHLTIIYAKSAADFIAYIGIGLTALLVRALILRAWALAELAYHQRRPQFFSWKKTLFTGFFKHLPRYGLWRIISLMSLLWCTVLLMFVLPFGLFFAAGGSIWWTLFIVFIVPLPEFILVYGIFRSLRIKYSLAEKMKDQTPGGVALEATA